MITFEQFIKRSAKLSDYLKSKGAELLMKNQTEIIKLSNEQLLQGINTEGKLMQKGYSKPYAKKRKKAGLQTSYVDLKFTGKYQDTKKGVKLRDGMDIRSSAEYEKYLRGNFPDHVGLTDTNAEIVSELLADEVVKLIEKYYS